MLPSKYKPNPPGGSGEKIFEGFLKGFYHICPYMGMVAILNFGSKPF